MSDSANQDRRKKPGESDSENGSDIEHSNVEMLDESN